MTSIVRTHSTGYFPTVVSPLSMIASACSNTAFATSVTSARVGIGFEIIDSSMCVATMTGAVHAHALLHDPPLDDRQLLHRALDPQVAPRHHDPVGFAR